MRLKRGALRVSEGAVRGISRPLKGRDALFVQAVQWPSARHRSRDRASGVRGQGAVVERDGGVEAAPAVELHVGPEAVDAGGE